MALQLLAIAIIAWSVLARRSDELTSPARQMVALGLAAGAVVALQLIPLPASFWPSFAGRGEIARGFALLGYPIPALSVSLTPYATIATILALLPAVAVFVATIRSWQRQGLIAASILLAAFAGVMLGALQVGSGGPGSPWYLYPITNRGAVGFFANSNHMGSLLLVCIPFAIAILASSVSRRKGRGSAVGMTALGVTGLLVVTSGLVLNRSLAALGIAVPVLLFSALLLPGGWKFRRVAVPLGSIAVLAAMLVLVRSPIAATQPGSEFASIESRAELWSATSGLAQQYFPVGSGLGSFASVFHLSENPATVGLKYANHAHNDYLELLLELGAPGAILLLLFLAWWLVQTVRVWRSGLTGYYARAATIASGALLAHSLVDYPLRTAALSSIFGVCVAFMAQPKPPKEVVAGDTRPARHLAIG
jgi:O-antigen ligase